MAEAKRSRAAGPGTGRVDIADAMMFLVAWVWAANDVIVKWAVEDIDPVAYVLSRFALVVLLLFPWLRWQRSSLRIHRADWLPLALSGVIGFAVYNLFFTLGLAHTTAFSGALLVSLGPVFALLLAAIIGMEVVRPVQWFGVAVSLTGMGVFVWEKLAGDLPARGDFLSLLAALFWAIYSLLAHRLGKYPAPVVTAWSALIGFLVAIPIGIGPVLDQDWGSVSLGGWAAMLYSSALSMLVAYSLWSWAIARRGVGRTVPYMFLVPILAGTLSHIFLDEDFGLLKIAGAALVLAGIGLVRGRSRPLPESSPTTPATDPTPDALSSPLPATSPCP